MDVLSRNGFGPAIYGRLSNGRVEQWLPGKTLKPDDMYAAVRAVTRDLLRSIACTSDMGAV